MKNKPDSISLPRKTTQAELAHLAQQGQLGAFAALFDLHKAAVYSLCRQTTSSVPEAERLTQDIFLHVFRNLSACPEGMDFSEWLHNAALSRLKIHERTMHLSAPFLDHLVVLATKPIGSHRAPASFARVRARIRDARAALAKQGSWVSVWTRFARPRQTAKALS
jgi:hypothetical protein